MFPKFVTPMPVSVEGIYTGKGVIEPTYPRSIIPNPKENKMKYVPVITIDGKPLMPTKLSRAKRWIAVGKATPFYKLGIFCARLNVSPSGTELQPIVIGIDPGSKKEGITVKSVEKDYLNLQTDAITWVKENKETQKIMRRSRRQRKTPCRKNRYNRRRGCLPPSTKSRWQHKINLVLKLAIIFPIFAIIIEDIKAKTKEGKNNWNDCFSPLEQGKVWAYKEFGKIAPVYLVEGTKTAAIRKQLGLFKTKNKLTERFDAHCVDSWVLCCWYLGGNTSPNNKDLMINSRIKTSKRQLHALQPVSGSKRRNYGGTRSLGFTRGSLVKHSKHGKVYIGGTMGGRISVHNIETGKRLAQNIKVEDCKFLGYNSYKNAYRGGSNSSHE